MPTKKDRTAYLHDYYLNHRKAKQKPPVQTWRQCVVCGKAFQAWMKRAIYCSPACSSKAYRARKAR